MMCGRTKEEFLPFTNNNVSCFNEVSLHRQTPEQTGAGISLNPSDFIRDSFGEWNERHWEFLTCRYDTIIPILPRYQATGRL